MTAQYKVRINRPDNSEDYLKTDDNTVDYIGSLNEAQYLANERNAYWGRFGWKYTVEPVNS